MVMTLPVMAAIAVLYQPTSMRPVSGVAGTITVGVCLLAALGVIGTLPSQSASARVVMVFAGLLATVVTLFCVAVMEILAREYVHDQLRQTNSAFGTVHRERVQRLNRRGSACGMFPTPRTPASS